jgi:hypothetical protein
VYTIFALYSPSYTLSPHPFPHTGTNLPEKTCSVLLLSDFVKEKMTFYLTQIYRKFPCDIFMYICIKPNWFIFSICLLSTLVPFLWGSQWV